MGVRLLAAMLVVSMVGCSQQQPGGSEASARKFFDAEVQKWMAGQETEVSTMKSRIGNLKNPISYTLTWNPRQKKWFVTERF